MNYQEMTLEQKRKLLYVKLQHVKYEESPHHINADYLLANSGFYAECDRELFVSIFPMLPLCEKTVDLEEADYILYSHPYARVEDMSPVVLAQLRYIDRVRKPGAEIVVVGKACNAESLLAEDPIDNMIFWDNHYAEEVGRKFGRLDIKDEYLVYDVEEKELNIWPVNGCLRKCKFCRRSYMHIPFESLDFEYIRQRLDWYHQNEPEKLAKIVLRAENLTEYGIDLYGKSRLADLIDLISSYDEVVNMQIIIGLAICEISDEILEAICRSGKFTLIAMNLEAGSDRLNQLIGKDHTRERAIYIAWRIREAMPGISLTTTVMVGLPTETLDDIYDLADLCIQTTMNHVQCNLYGSAPGYPLNSLPQLSESLRRYHLNLLVKLMKEKKLASGNERILIIEYETFYKRKSKKRALAEIERRNRMEWYCKLTWHMVQDAYISQLGRFIRLAGEDE